MTEFNFSRNMGLDPRQASGIIAVNADSYNHPKQPIFSRC
jgi:hypothetical protein